MLNFGNAKALHHRLEENTNAYLERFFQGILDKFCEQANPKSSLLLFYECASFPASFEDDFLVEIDPESFLDDLTFEMELHFDGILYLYGFNKYFYNEACMNAVVAFLESHGFSKEDEENSYIFMKKI